jgi:putative restriction endonuclease
MSSLDYDDRLRAAAFAYLDQLNARARPVSTEELTSFTFEGERIPLLQHMRGIRVVAGLEDALSIRTAYAARPEDRPYADEDGSDGYRRYKWQGTNPMAHDNQALRNAMRHRKPLMYFLGIAPNVLLSFYPVWVVGEEQDNRQFKVALDEIMRDQGNDSILPHPADLALRRQYAEQTTRVRLHQRAFRERVLLAYERQCAVCRLRHAELLDAAHIREDSDGGEPVVSNGLAMCAIHHRAFDVMVLGVRPDCVVEIRLDILKEHDGPTLQHALQGVHHARLSVPGTRALRPNRDLLEERYARFQAAS